MPKKLVRTIILVAVIITSLGGWRFYVGNAAASPIKVGILHSLTGTMAISEKSVVDATQMAIDEINQSGGVLGHQLQAISLDGKSDWPTFASDAEQLLTKDRVSVVFGCWTSASRKTVEPVFQKYNGLLVYPVQYEGLEQSPNIIYTGAAPNQQVLPAVQWAFNHLGKTFFLVGSDYVFPRSANAIMKDQITKLGGKVVGEDYVLLGSTNVQAMIKDIKATHPAVILNTINGDSNVTFFRALRAAGITPRTIPTISFSIAEDELRSMEPKNMVGDYAAWNYFQSIQTPENATFVAHFKQRFGQDRVVDDPMEAAYFGVYLWANAAKAAGSTDVAAVRAAIGSQTFDAPEGLVYVDPTTQHTFKTARVGQIQADGQFQIVWSSGVPLRPIPFPNTRSQTTWSNFLIGLYNGWGQRWANPGTVTHS